METYATSTRAGIRAIPHEIVKVKSHLGSFVLLLLWLVGATVMACALNSAPVAAPSASAPPLTPTAAATRDPATAAPITTTRPITLTLWTSEEFAPGDTPAGRILRSQFDAFNATYPNFRVEVVLKKTQGKGGLLDALLTTHAVAPILLPDLIVLDLAELPLAAQAGVLQSYDGFLPTELNNDLFPFAKQAAHVQNRWVGMPFAADAQHLVYHKTLVRKVPLSWDDVLRLETPLAMPLGGDDAFLLQYAALASPGVLPTPLALDPSATAQVLSFFKRARDARALPPNALALTSAGECWRAFADGQVPMAQVLASRYLAERDRLPNALYAVVPTRDGKTATLANAWAFALVTADPTRQAVAARFVQFLTQSERLSPWLRAARRLPASRTPLSLAVEPPEYATFVRDMLERATAVPHASAYAKSAAAWRAGIAAVWRGETTPEEAARTIAAVK